MKWSPKEYDALPLKFIADVITVTNVIDQKRNAPKKDSSASLPTRRNVRS